MSHALFALTTRITFLLAGAQALWRPAARGILPREMADETMQPQLDSSDPRPRARVNERRRKWMRRTGTLLIVCGVVGVLGLVLYFVGTCAYTAREQDRLREELAAANPELAAAEATVSEDDFVSIAALAENAAGTVAAAAADAERRARLLELKAAADVFAERTRGHTGEAIGRILIPSIGVDVIMVEGDAEGRSENYLREGPGHWPETPFPGQGGSFVASGHRTTWGAPFFKLNELSAGDVIELVLPYALIRYEVTEVIVVSPTALEVVRDQGKEQVSLVACHPIYSARQRIIAQGDMTAFVLIKSRNEAP
jgi:LPXTG-site transpeptidase (sortase) family protein